MFHWRLYLRLFLTITFWGASFIASKIALRVMEPVSIIILRFSIGLSIIVIVLLIQGRGTSIPKKELPALAFLGFLGITLHQWLQLTGLETAAATTGAWIVATIPVFVAIMGWLFLNESMGKERVLGIAIAMVGALAVVGNGKLIDLFSGRVGRIGDFLFLLSSINWAVFTVLSRRFLDKTKRVPEDSANLVQETKTDHSNHPLKTMAYVMGFGWIFSLIWFGIEGNPSDFSNLTGEVLWAILFLGVASSGLAYIFWYQALGVLGATRTGVFLYFEPVITALIAWPVLGESMSLAAIVGGIAIVLGVWLVNRG